MALSMTFYNQVLKFTLAVIATAFTSIILHAAEPLPKDQHAVLPVEEIVLVSSAGEFRFSAEIADTGKKRQVGLMFREEMLPTHGMLFDFEKTETVAMWMKNTPRALDMIFIKPDGTIARIAKKTTPFSTDIITSGEPVSHVLELNAGITVQIGLKAGDKIRHRFFE